MLVCQLQHVYSIITWGPKRVSEYGFFMSSMTSSARPGADSVSWLPNVSLQTISPSIQVRLLARANKHHVDLLCIVHVFIADATQPVDVAGGGLPHKQVYRAAAEVCLLHYQTMDDCRCHLHVWDLCILHRLGDGPLGGNDVIITRVPDVVTGEDHQVWLLTAPKYT